MTLKHQIPSKWQTKKLVIKDAVRHELENLQVVYDDCRYIEKWSGVKSRFKQPMLAEYQHRYLPPKGRAELHRLQSIHIKTTGELIGYLIAYHGYPDKGTFWIADLMIRKKFQKRGYGRELIAKLEATIRGLKSFRKIGLAVVIKNWPALRFWLAAGFNEIVKFKGDKICTERTYALLVLNKEI